jgi:hypothetical protein
MGPAELVRRLPLVLLGFSTGVLSILLLGALPAALIWPAVALISTTALCTSLVWISRAGIRVEIFTRESIAVSTRRGAIQAEVTRLRI